MTQSLAELAMADPSAARAWWESLDPAVAEALTFDWGYWARPEQLPPAEDWVAWLIQAGRGWGKTRVGAEWVRGSSAIVDNFRCVLQLTLINADEAAGAGLDEDKARQGGYAVFGATKLNGGQKSDWLFVEQDEHGRWFAPKDGIETLARIRGAKAAAALSRQIALLVDIYTASRFGAEPDRDALAKCHAPADSKDPGAWFRSNIRRLRNSGLLQKTGFALTVEGVQQVQRVTRKDSNHEES